MKAQASLEYLILVGIILLVIVPLFYYSFNKVSYSLKLNDLDDATNALANAADEVYSLGPGSKKYVAIRIPAGVNEILIGNSTILFKTSVFGGVSDIYSKTLSNVTGYINTISGTYNVPVEMLDSGIVLIGNLSINCGDEVCELQENCVSCPSDCGSCVCGNNICEAVENCSSCAVDCGECSNESAYCGDLICSGEETCISCLGDCGNCTARCGDNICVWWLWNVENCNNCPIDCLESWQLCCPFDTEGTWYYPSDGSSCPAPVVANCADYCVSLGYASGVCRQNEAQCNINDEVYKSGGNPYCIAGPVGDFCCCI